MRVSLRLIFSLVVGVTLLSLLFAVFQVKREKRGLQRELENRAAMLGENLEGKISPLLNPVSHKRLQAVITKFEDSEHLQGIAIFDKSGVNVASTPGLDSFWRAARPQISQAIASRSKYAEFTLLDGKPSHVYILPILDDSEMEGALAIFHDASFIKVQTTRLWRGTFLNLLVEAVFIALVTFLIVRWSIMGPIARATKWMSEVRAGRRDGQSGLENEDLFKPLAREVKHLAKNLEVARAAAEEEARLRVTAEALWTPERLRLHVRGKLGDRPFFVISNREPYMHTYRGKNVEVTVPASGLVTAIEPILRTCQGMWLAHGSGDADRQTVDERDCLAVPPDEPQYTLKRVWLSKEEEEGYYFGFSNEGLWPLCHIAHTRPIFRAKDCWSDYYQAVNRKFTRGVLIHELRRRG